MLCCNCLFWSKLLSGMFYFPFWHGQYMVALVSVNYNCNSPKTTDLFALFRISEVCCQDLFLFSYSESRIVGIDSVCGLKLQSLLGELLCALCCSDCFHKTLEIFYKSGKPSCNFDYVSDPSCFSVSISHVLRAFDLVSFGPLMCEFAYVSACSCSLG